VPAAAGGRDEAGHDTNRVFARFVGALHVLSFEAAGEGAGATALGRAVQVELMNPVLKAPGTQRFKL
jgi:hypothetical protein